MKVRECDFLCIGGGLGGLAAAVRGSDLGLDVLIVEKSPYLGGVAAYSGGVVWVGNNHLQAVDDPDSVEDVEHYLNWVNGDGVGIDEDLRRVLVEQTPLAIAYYRDEVGIAFESTELPDQYYPDAPGSKPRGRILEVTARGTDLGEWQHLTRLSPHFRLVGLTHREVMEAGGDTVASENLGDLLRQRNEEDFRTWGPGLAAAFVKAAVIDRQVPVELEAPARSLIQSESTTVGAVVSVGGEDVSVMAREGVLIASGSYGNAPYAASLEGLPEVIEASPPVLDGDSLTLTDPTPAALVRSGKPFTLLGFASPDEVHPGTDVPLHRELSRGLGLPHSIVVNQEGRRFGDESFYGFLLSAVQTYDSRAKTFTNYPCFLVGDSRYRARYPLGDLDRWPGTLIQANDLPGLAAALGIDPGGLTQQVARFNEHADSGEDPEFQRGTLAYSRLRAGDPNQLPNPNLGSISEPPFWGLQLRLIGTGIYSMGVSINGWGQVLTRAGEPVPGLYATGNAVAYTEQPGYVGGLANARGITYGYRAAGHAAGKVNG